MSSESLEDSVAFKPERIAARCDHIIASLTKTIATLSKRRDAQ